MTEDTYSTRWLHEHLVALIDRVEALESRLPLNSRVDPPGCPACNGVAGTACRCAEPDDTPDGMLHDAWSVIANAPVRGWGFSGSANEQEQEWIDAAMRWRDAWHKTLNPEPVPEWRRLADAGVRNLAYTHEDPLVVVLRSLSNIANPQKDTTANLARIIAVCEGQVGDGWQAEPPTGAFGAYMSVRSLIKEGWTPDGHPRWQGLANAAAAWLRDLLKEQS